MPSARAWITAAATALALLAFGSTAFASDTLTVFVENDKIAQGASTTIGAHAQTDAGYGGGRILFKTKPADQACAPIPVDDVGQDANGPQTTFVDAGAASTDGGGQTVEFDVGSWRVCAWLIDDGTGAVVAVGSTVVEVVPFIGSISITVKRVRLSFQVVLSYSTSAPGRLYASMQLARKRCSASPRHIPKRAILLVPRAGRFIGSDGGLGRAVPRRRLARGKWRVCAWLVADAGSVGPATKAFSVPRRRRHGGRAASG